MDLSQKDKTYSHGGIAFLDSGDVYVYHIDTEFGHTNDKVRKEKMDSFCNPAKNLGLGLARYNLDSTENKALIAYMDKLYVKQIPFDWRFDVTTDDSLYCSEMIMKGLKAATKNRIQIETLGFNDRSKYRVIMQNLKLTEKELRNRIYVPVDGLYIRPDCQVLKRYVFE